MIRPSLVLVAAIAWAVFPPGPSAATSLRFHGNGVGAPGLDRVKIPVDDVGDAEPGPPADIGATDFTIEFWMKAVAAENTAGAVSCGENVAWIEGNIVVDRDRFDQGRKFGLSIAGGRMVFGVSGESSSRTVCGARRAVAPRGGDARRVQRRPGGVGRRRARRLRHGSGARRGLRRSRVGSRDLRETPAVLQGRADAAAVPHAVA